MKFRTKIQTGHKYYARYVREGFEHLHGVYEVLVIYPYYEIVNNWFSENYYICYVLNTLDNDKHWTFEKRNFITEITD